MREVRVGKVDTPEVLERGELVGLAVHFDVLARRDRSLEFGGGASGGGSVVEESWAVELAVPVAACVSLSLARLDACLVVGTVSCGRGPALLLRDTHKRHPSFCRLAAFGQAYSIPISQSHLAQTDSCCWETRLLTIQSSPGT
jgi:hypothetical protein